MPHKHTHTHTHTLHSLSQTHTLSYTHTHTHTLSLSLSLSQIARLQAELERSHAATVAKEHELGQAMEQLQHLSQERELLLRTTEMYETDKRELQDEVCV